MKHNTDTYSHRNQFIGLVTRNKEQFKRGSHKAAEDYKGRGSCQRHKQKRAVLKSNEPNKAFCAKFTFKGCAQRCVLFRSVRRK